MPVITYPADLGTAPDLQHYVMFFINVREGSAQLPGTTATGIGVIPGGAGGPSVVGAIGEALGRSVLPDALSGTNRLYRLDTAIALYLNEKPQATYKANYDNIDLGASGHLAKILSSPKSFADQATTAENWAAIATRMGSTITSMISGANESISAITKMRLNPYKQAYFDHMDFRRFRFAYRFHPRSPGEAAAIKQVVDLFKFHMHPELSSNTAFMMYPSEFDIVYFWGGAENRYWHRISSCVLEELNVEYGGDQFQSFYGGVPSEVLLTLTFHEIETLTKERIAQGY